MLFNPQVELAKIRAREENQISGYSPATSATSATQRTNRGNSIPQVADVAGVAGANHHNEKNGLCAITPNKPKPIATADKCRVADVAEVAGGNCQNRKALSDSDVIINMVASGAERHGAIATRAGISATVTYQLIDRLIASGRLIQSKDGVLSVVDGD